MPVGWEGMDFAQTIGTANPQSDAGSASPSLPADADSEINRVNEDTADDKKNNS